MREIEKKKRSARKYNITELNNTNKKNGSLKLMHSHVSLCTVI